MLTQLRRSVVLALVFAVLCGIVYPVVEVGLSNVLFPSQAQGSLISNGSIEIGQSWSGTKWFHGRPGTYNDTATGGTNLGPRSRTLLDNTKKLVAFWHSVGVTPTQELVTTSGSQVDPDISPRSAYVQIPMVSKATGISASRLRSLVKSQISGPQYGIFGDRFVNVLKLNDSLARLEGVPVKG